LGVPPGNQRQRLAARIDVFSESVEFLPVHYYENESVILWETSDLDRSPRCSRQSGFVVVSKGQQD
jgi:hypothetical protein